MSTAKNTLGISESNLGIQQPQKNHGWSRRFANYIGRGTTAPCSSRINNSEVRSVIGEASEIIGTDTAKICDTTSCMSPLLGFEYKVGREWLFSVPPTFRFMMVYLSSFLVALLLAGANAFPPQDSSLQNRQNVSGSKCKCYEGESCWPSATVWSTLNATVDGFLRKVVPAGAVCYSTFEGKNTYNSSACSIATINWNQQSWQ